MSKQLIKFLLMIIIVGVSAGLNAHAFVLHPTERPRNTLESLIWLVNVDSGVMIQAAYDQRDKNPRIDRNAIARLEDLHLAATHLYEQLNELNRDVVDTLNEYLTLREAYFQARPCFDVLEGSEDIRAAVWRTRDMIRNVARYYNDHLIVETPYTDKKPGATRDWRLRQIAADIARQADHLASDAREQQLHGQVSKDVAQRFFELGESARRFHEQVVRSGGDVVVLAPGYKTLVARMQGARDVVGDFNLNFQNDFGLVWRLTEQINGLAPETPLGEYQIIEFHRW